MFMPVVRMETVRAIVAIVVQHKWRVYQMDVKSTFLNGVLKGVYVAQPPGYEIEGQEDKCYGSDDFLITDFKQFLKSEFEMTNLGLLRYFLGIEVKQTENGIFISQAKFMETPRETHWQVAKRILRYVNGTKQYGILYTAISDFRLVGHTDSDWAGSADDRKRTSGYVFHLGSGAISWASKKHPVVSLSTTEAEYVTTTTIACQAVWMRRMLRDLCHYQEGATTIFCDNTSAIALLKGSVFHKRTKHIDVKYHFIRELINNDEIVLQHYRS
eukprot:PITA_35494